MKVELDINDDIDTLKNHLATRVSMKSQQSIIEKGFFSIALSGGSLPSLLSEISRIQTDWSLWKIFFVDERCVLLDHPDSNYFSSKQEIFDKISILCPSPSIFAIESDDPEKASKRYEYQIRSEISSELSFDMILLGMGPDGHTASLFPGHDLIYYTGPNLVMPIFDSPKLPARRITMTLNLINNSKEIIIVATGESKAAVISEILQTESDGSTYCTRNYHYPVSLVSATNKVSWILDKAAASKLK